jgi:hypothetical protein
MGYLEMNHIVAGYVDFENLKLINLSNKILIIKK